MIRSRCEIRLSCLVAVGVTVLAVLASAPAWADFCSNGPGSHNQDTDGDSYVDCVDNCPLQANDQSDQDGDGVGDACDCGIDVAPGDALSLRNAVALAPSGCAIAVPAGRYVLTGIGNAPLLIRTSVSLLGAGAGATVIDRDGGEGTVVDNRPSYADAYPALGVFVGGVTITGGETGVATRGSYEITGRIRLSDVVISSNGTGARIAPSGDSIPRGEIDLYNSVVIANDVGVTVLALSGDLSFPDLGGKLSAWYTRFEQNGLGIEVHSGDYPGGGGTALFTVCTIDSNREGGVWVGPGDARVTLVDSTISHNSSSDSGGGIYIGRVLGGLSTSDNFPLVFLDRCTVSGNTAMIDGGGIYNGGVLAPGPVGASPSELRLWNVTISGNTAAGAGGGVYNDGSADPASEGGKLICRNCTISDNHASMGGGVAFGTVNPGQATFANSVIGGNAATTSPDCSGELEGRGHDLIGDASGCVITGDTTGNLLGVDPQLGPLADNGGFTTTHALSASSPAIDAGGETCLEVDQRGVSRPQDGDGDGVARCDIGAYEYTQTPGSGFQIDIKPGSDANSINPRSRGVIPVAILGSDSFDVTTVDEKSLRFGPGEAPIAHRHAHLEDVNLDGFVDLMLHFRTDETGIVCGDDAATLTAETLDGQPIKGTDSITTVGCRMLGRPGAWPSEEDQPLPRMRSSASLGVTIGIP